VTETRRRHERLDKILHFRSANLAVPIRLFRIGSRESPATEILDSRPAYTHYQANDLDYARRENPMTLSNKKRKFIKRNSQTMTPLEISQTLGIRLREVKEVLESSPRATFAEKTSSTLFAALPWCLAVMCLVAPFLFVRNTYDFANLPQSMFLQLGTLLLAALWFFAAAAGGGKRLRVGPPAIALMAFLLWASISLLYAHNKWEGEGLLVHWWACGVAYFVVLNSMRNENDCRRLLAALTAAAAGIAVLGIFQYLTGFDAIPQSVSPAATFANKNMAAHFMVLSLPVAGALFLTSGRQTESWLAASAAALMLVFLFYTKTKAAWLALAVEIAVAVALVIREKFRGKPLRLPRFKYAAIAVCLISTTLMMNTGPEGFGTGISSVISEVAPIFVDEQGDAGRAIPYASKGLRLDIWRNTVEMIKDRPLLGFGLGNHKVFYPAYHSRAVAEQVFSEAFQLHNVHNDFLQVFSEMGIVGILTAAWLALVFLRAVIRNFTAFPAAPLRIEVGALGVAAVGIFINSSFCFPLERAVPTFVLAVYLAIASVPFAEKETRLKSFSSSRWIPTAAGAIFLFAFFWVASYSSRVIASDKHYLVVSSLEKAAAWKPLIREAEKAHELNPRRLKTLSYMGRAYVESGMHKEGMEVLLKVIDAYPYHMNALLNLGVALSSLERMDEALSVYRKVLEIKPSYAKAHNNMGNIHMKQQKFEKALESFRKATELDPNNSLIHFNLGVAEIQLKNFENAAEAFKRTIELKPDWGLARKNLGIVYAQYMNRPEEALIELREALKINPAMKDADQIRALIDNIESR
jgi:Flp pilus assembly protein TadD/O-antigen ligase